MISGWLSLSFIFLGVMVMMMMMMIMMISWKHFFCLFQKTSTHIITKLERFICPQSYSRNSDRSIFLVSFSAFRFQVDGIMDE